jgi:two-component system osmolarity sensor histidine kinase EnvZ
MGLFWRTFILLAVLVFGSTLAWMQTFRTQEFEPSIKRNAQQIASVVTLTRTALKHSDAIARVALLKSLSDEEGVVITTREPGDQFIPLGTTALETRLSQALMARLGKNTVLASEVNKTPGIWVGFKIERDSYWLQLDPDRLQPIGGKSWLQWMILTGLLSLAGAAVIAGLINHPLKRLSRSFARMRDGQMQDTELDEDVRIDEIRELNMGFNSMVRKLQQAEQERSLMLAGISHDLRTPLARLRLEAELSVPDAQARELMSADITQMDQIISKFMDYARPGETPVQAVALAGLVSRSIGPFRNNKNMHIELSVPEDILVLADEVELGRVFDNLLENARRYGQSPKDGITRISIAAQTLGADTPRVKIVLTDQGAGVSPEALSQLTQPFFRADSARTSALGSGLGLSIVERSIDRMGGQLVFSTPASGGLQATIFLRQAV